MTKTKIIQLKKSNKRGIYKDILSDTEKIKEILKKKKKTNKNYEYLNNNILFDKYNNVINESKSKYNSKKSNFINKQPIYKKNNKIKQSNSIKISKQNLSNQQIPKQINVSLSKKKTFQKKKYKPSKIKDYFNKKKKLTKNTNDIKIKVLRMLKKILNKKNNNNLLKFINNLNLISTKLIATYLNLTNNANKVTLKFLKTLIYLSLCNNIIIFKLN